MNGSRTAASISPIQTAPRLSQIPASLQQVNHLQARAALHGVRSEDHRHVRPWHDSAGIQGYLAEIYGTDVSPDFISKVTDEVMAEVVAWQSRPLEPMYPVVFFDALRVKIRDDAVVRNKAVYLALGVLPDGTRDVLGIWIEQTEGAKFWLKVFNQLRSRGVGDILIAVVDGLKGLTEAIETAFPSTTVADVHRAPDPQQLGLRELERAQGDRRGPTSNLRGSHR